jgi:hypothetical protein
MVFVQVLAESVQGRSSGTSCDIIYMHVQYVGVSFHICNVLCVLRKKTEAQKVNV